MTGLYQLSIKVVEIPLQYITVHYSKLCALKNVRKSIFTERVLWFVPHVPLSTQELLSSRICGHILLHYWLEIVHA